MLSDNTIKQWATKISHSSEYHKIFIEAKNKFPLLSSTEDKTKACEFILDKLLYTDSVSNKLQNLMPQDTQSLRMELAVHIQNGLRL